MTCFIISENVPNEKAKLIKSEIDSEKYFLNSVRILVGTVERSIDLFVLSVPRISSASFLDVGDMKKVFLFELFMYESKDFNVFAIFVTRLLAIDVKKLLN